MLIIIFCLITLIMFCLKVCFSINKNKSKSEFLVYLPTKKFKIVAMILLVLIILFWILYVWRDFKLSHEIYIGFCLLYLLYYFQYLRLSATYIEVYKEKLIFNLPFKKRELFINNIENIEINKVKNKKYNEILSFNNKLDGSKVEIRNLFYNYDKLKLLLQKGKLITDKKFKKRTNDNDKYNFKFHFFLVILVMMFLPLFVFLKNNDNYFEEQDKIELKDMGYSEEKINQLDKQGMLAENVFYVIFGIGFVNGLYFYLIWIRDRHTLVKIILVFVAFIISPVISICGIIKLKSLINDFKLLIQNDKVKN